MAFSSLFDKNIFNQNSYAKMVDDSNGQYKIIITPIATRKSGNKDMSIKGVLTEELNFNFKAEYDTFGFGGLISNSKWLETAYKALSMPLRIQGRNVDNVGIVSEKFYVKSGYLNISPSFRVTDWFGDGAPLKTAKALASYCLPEGEQKLDDFIQKIQESANDIEAIAKVMKSPLAEKLKEGLKKGLLLAEKGYNNVGNKFIPDSNLGTTAKDTIKKGINNGLWITSSPTPVEVVVGNWFVNSNMVIEDVSLKFSKEMTKIGPLYVDISLQMSSKEAIRIGSDGFEFKTKRVFTNGSTQVNGTGVR